ncbi:MAG TPA: 2,3-bisphosphoglycerate-dependent phosphoglycerate mutase [Candidatus Saccharimonadales bacterium]|nr:2,3-bisphosphoglycerate-dependent phosphoglycerate mutase [Candidatus Saccharimonadales bacterium]
MSKLILVRHGESEYNAKGLWTGWLDPVLSPKGREHARKIGEKLKEHEIKRAFVSDLKRAQDTWDIIHHNLTDGENHLPVTAHKDLNERHYGVFAGQNKWQVKEKVGEEEFMKIRRAYDYRPPEGESLKDVYERAVPYFSSNIKPFIDEGEIVISVTHGNTNRALIKHIDRIRDEHISQVEMPHELIIVYHFKNGEVVRKETIEIE